MKKLKSLILLAGVLGAVYLGSLAQKYGKLTTLLNSSYLVLLQNNNELRPTGGFAGSYARFDAKNGKIQNLIVSDIYDADGLVEGHVEPPEPIQTAFGLGEWRLRDANWEADFSQSAEKLSWFFEKANVKDYQVMAAVNLSVFEELLKFLGKVELPDYNEVITADNLWEKAQYYSQNNFFPGSKQKREFLGDLGFAVKEKLIEADVVTKFRALGLARKMFDEKQIMLWTRDSELESLFDEFNWSGRLKSGKCSWFRRNCISESLVINEANLGVNKANYGVSRDVKLTVVREGNVLKHNLSIKFVNNAVNEWGGKYKAWVRVYAPTPDNVQGFWVEVPVGEEKTYQVLYDLRVNLSQGPVELYIQKQSGIKEVLVKIEYYDGNKGVIRDFVLVKDTRLSL